MSISPNKASMNGQLNSKVSNVTENGNVDIDAEYMLLPPPEEILFNKNTSNRYYTSDVDTCQLHVICFL